MVMDELTIRTQLTLREARFPRNSHGIGSRLVKRVHTCGTKVKVVGYDQRR